jgi:hypothetical protein
LIDLGFSTVLVVERTTLGLNNVKREAQGIHEERGGLGRSGISTPGVFVVKLPGQGSRGPELALEIKSRRRPGPAPEEAEGTWSGRI